MATANSLQSNLQQLHGCLQYSDPNVQAQKAHSIVGDLMQSCLEDVTAKEVGKHGSYFSVRTHQHPSATVASNHLQGPHRELPKPRRWESYPTHWSTATLDSVATSREKNDHI